MDWSWRCTELVTAVTTSEPTRLPCVCGYMIASLYAHKVNTREKLLQRILRAQEVIKNTAVLRNITSSVVTRVRKFIQADRGHFEKFA